MNLNKANLNVVSVVNVDKDMPLLNNVHVSADGSTVAANRRATIAVEGLSTPTGSSVTIAAETIKEVLKALPSDKRFGDLLDNVKLSCSSGAAVFVFNDGVRSRSIEARTYKHGFIDYRERFRRASTDSSYNVVINRKRLLSVLQALEKIAPDSSGEFPLFLEFTRTHLLIRLQHPKTGQHIVCAIVLSEVDQWLERNKWEESLTGEDKTKTKTKRKNHS